MIRRAAVLLTALLLAMPGATALAAEVTLPDVEDEVMCPTCKMPLDTAQSPQADDQREFIRGLIAQGMTKEEIKEELVAEYGENVLADPADDGFGLAAYLVPIALIVVLAAALFALLPRRRRRAPAPTAATGGGPALSADDAARLDADLARYDP